MLVSSLQRHLYKHLKTRQKDLRYPLKLIHRLEMKSMENIYLGHWGICEEYFDNEMKKNNYEIVIIKLCVKLEAILHCDYKYIGDFSEMLDLYCNKQIDTYSEIARLLNKLRMQRNSIVHAEKNDETLSLEELQRCVEYICNLS